MRRLVMLPALATGLSTLNSIHMMRRGHIILCKWAAVCPDATETASLNDAPYPAARVFGQVLRAHRRPIECGCVYVCPRVQRPSSLISGSRSAQFTGIPTLSRAVHYFFKEQTPYGIPHQLPVHPRT